MKFSCHHLTSVYLAKFQPTHYKPVESRQYNIIFARDTLTYKMLDKFIHAKDKCKLVNNFNL